MKYSRFLSKKLFFLTLVLSLSFSFTPLKAECEYAETLKVEEYAMGNMLSWATAREFNNQSFLIEKSEDGQHFAVIGSVKGNGTTNEQHAYMFLDISASKGVAYYRLKQINIDRTFSYSTVASINKALGNNFTVVSMTPPDADHDIFELTINAVSEEILSYTIFDLEGNPIYAQRQLLKKGINIITVDISNIEEEALGFASNQSFGKNLPYKLSLKGAEEVEELTIGKQLKKTSKN